MAKRYTLCEEYYNLKDEVKSVEVLKRELEEILREGSLDVPNKEHSRAIR